MDDTRERKGVYLFLKTCMKAFGVENKTEMF